jgi:hypothetical protein
MINPANAAVLKNAGIPSNDLQESLSARFMRFLLAAGRA